MLVECRDVAFAYEGSVVLEGLRFRINKGDYVLVVGENGTGKTTLIKGLLRLKAPCAGAVVFNPALGKNALGYLPQQAAAQKDFPASVLEVVLSGQLNRLGWRPFYTRKDKQAAFKHMRNLGIDALANMRYGSLSGGQRQRVLLCRALCAADDALLLDEPLSGLDPLVRGEFYSLMGRLNREQGLTVVMVSHDVHGAIDYASHVLHLDHHQVFYGDTAEYITTDACRRLTGGCAHG